MQLIYSWNRSKKQTRHEFEVIAKLCKLYWFHLILVIKKYWMKNKA